MDSLAYARAARLLHWVIAALVIANILTGLLHDPLGDVFAEIMPLHKAMGITIVALTLARIMVRLTHKPPPLPADMPGWERRSAHGVHMLFYLLMLALPLTGWIMSSAGKYPLTWFWLFDIPKFAVTRGDAIVMLSRGSHGLLGIAFGLLALLHIAAALRHHVVLKDQVLRRMLG